MRALVAVALVGQLVLPRPSQAQHARVSPAQSPESPGACGVCHTTHPDGPSAFALILDRQISDRAAWLRHQARGVSQVSLSCLRCHTSSDVRRQQPEFSRRASLASERSFLGFDLGDDHLLGGFDPLLRRSPHAGMGPTDPQGARGSMPILGDTALVIECTTCHDPHDRVSAIPDAAKQRMVCGTCHDLSTYLTRHHSARACSDCHALHGSGQGALLAGRGPEETCGGCHGGLGTLPGENRTGGVATRGPPLPLSSGHHLGADCVSCHRVHER